MWYIPILEFLELLGFAIVTCWKKIFNWEYINDISFPRNIFAINVPSCLRICVVIFKAANNSCDCIYSSISWSPVTVKNIFHLYY